MEKNKIQEKKCIEDENEISERFFIYYSLELNI